MRLVSSLVMLLFLSVVLSACSRHEPPDEVVRDLCKENAKQDVTGTELKEGLPSINDVEVNVVEISRKGLGESKNTRDIPDKTLVYTIACLQRTTINGIESEPETLFLYFFHNNDGEWVVRKRLQSWIFLIKPYHIGRWLSYPSFRWLILDRDQELVNRLIPNLADLIPFMVFLPGSDRVEGS